MKRRQVITAIAAVSVAIVTLATLRVVRLVRSDDYSTTKHAVSKLLPGLGIDMMGEITVELPSGLRIEGIVCSDEQAVAEFVDGFARVRLGHSLSTIEISCDDLADQRWLVNLDVMKLNSWSKIRISSSGTTLSQLNFEVSHDDIYNQVSIQISVTRPDIN